MLPICFTAVIYGCGPLAGTESVTPSGSFTQTLTPSSTDTMTGLAWMPYVLHDVIECEDRTFFLNNILIILFHSIAASKIKVCIAGPLERHPILQLDKLVMTFSYGGFFNTIFFPWTRKCKDETRRHLLQNLSWLLAARFLDKHTKGCLPFCKGSWQV